MTDTDDPKGPGAPAWPTSADDVPPHPAHLPFIRIMREHGCRLSEAALGRFLTNVAATGPLFMPHWQPIDAAPKGYVDLWAVDPSEGDDLSNGGRFPDCRRDPADPTRWEGLPDGWRPTHFIHRPVGPEGPGSLAGKPEVLSRFGPNTRVRAMVLAHVLADYGLSLERHRAVTLLGAFLAGERGEALGMPRLAAEDAPEAIAAAWEAAGVAEFLPQAEAARAALWPSEAAAAHDEA